MPRRKPDSVVTHRVELGGKEREIASDLVVAAAVPGVALLGAGAAVGIGLWAGMLFINNSLDDVTSWLKKTWSGEDWKYRQEALRELQDATNRPMDPNIINKKLKIGGRGSIRSWEDGLTPYQSYYQTWMNIRDCTLENYNAWIREHDLNIDDNSALVWFQSNCNDSSLTGEVIAMAGPPGPLINTLVGESIITDFGYQMSIRETAARRAQSIVAPALLWSGWLLPNSWKNANVQDAPGYIKDPFLDLAWTRLDFKGPDALVGPQQLLNTWYINRGYDWNALVREWSLLEGQERTDSTQWPLPGGDGWVDDWNPA